MVEISLVLLITTTIPSISTIIIVTMATIFFCCWRKKGSCNKDKTDSTKEDLRKERSASPAPALGGSENGIVTEMQSSLENVSVDSKDQLGDFSAVQRETEILRSYRKPPPPKNRAKQTRAPRVIKSGTESLDIFAELSEEDGKNENISTFDEFDSSLLRPHSEQRNSTAIDARSSMLADIDQTLAALHMSEQQSMMQVSREGSLSEEKSNITESSPKLIDKSKNDKQWSASEVGQADHTGDYLVPEVRASQSLAYNSYEIQGETTSMFLSPSPKSSPHMKPKQGPKVSPKPTHRIIAQQTSMGHTLAAESTTDKHTDVQNSSSLKSSNLDIKGNEEVSVHQRPISETEISSTFNGITSIMSTISKPIAESVESKTQLDMTSSMPTIDAMESNIHSEQLLMSNPTLDSVESFVQSDQLTISKQAADSLSDNTQPEALTMSNPTIDSMENNVHSELLSLSMPQTDSAVNITHSELPTVDKSPADSMESNIHSEDNLFTCGSPTQYETRMALHEEKTSESYVDDTNTDKSKTVAKTKENGMTTLDSHEGITTNISESTTSKGINGTKETSESEANVFSSKEISSPSKRFDLNSDIAKFSLPTEIKTMSTESPSEMSSSLVKETASDESEDGIKMSENGKQRRESPEDHAGKGKISKIPVRAGSKPRTSPPKQSSIEKASSPTK